MYKPHYSREQALQYVSDPSGSDTQRSLKRSWKATATQRDQESEPSGSSSAKRQYSSEEKGKFPIIFYINDGYTIMYIYLYIYITLSIYIQPAKRNEKLIFIQRPQMGKKLFLRQISFRRAK